MSLGLEGLIGSLLGSRYMIESEIGKGRSGVVFKAIDQTLNRPVAIKLLYENMGDRNSLERFKREAMAAGTLNHPNIITVFDFGLSPENFAFLVLEFLEGEDLHTILTRDGKLPLNRAIGMISQLCLALGHAHKHGLIHRDLKPSNIMLRNLEGFDDFVKIVDFGIAKRFDVDDETVERLTLEGQVLGTPAYMSPEQCQSRALDARSDIYSLGCVFFRMIAGAPPINGNNLLDLINGHLNRQPLSFNDIPGVHVPMDIQKVILKTLAKKPEDRPQSMFDLRLQLTAAYASTLEAAPRSYVSPSSPSAAATLSASSGDAQAQFELAMKLEKGEGMQPDPEESRRWLRQAAERGHAEAQCRMALVCMRSEVNDLGQALEWLKKSAHQGFPNAQFALAQCYETGTGTVVNLPQAVMWYQEAARQGNKQAEAQLSICYNRCYESGEDSVGMESWLRERAAGGEPSSLMALAKYLSRRIDAEKFQPEIHHLCAQSAERGDPEAQLKLARDYLNPSRPELHDKAYYWATASANQGSIEAMVLRAVCIRHGFGTPADPAGALQIMEQVSGEDKNAQTIVACSLLLGDGLPRNITNGIAMLKAAAASGGFAQWKLALCYKNGLGTTRDAREVERLLRLSSDGRFNQGPYWSFSQPALSFGEAVQTIQSMAAVDNKQAYHWLGICHEDGLSVPKDINKALQFYNKAAQKGHTPAVAAVARLRGLSRV